MKALPESFWIQPAIARTTMTTKELREILLQYDGVILAQGYFWEIQNKSLGAGVYRVWLKLSDT